LIKKILLGVFFGGEDALVFLKGDAALWFAFGLGPEFGR
jgi:hypothetical protein